MTLCVMCGLQVEGAPLCPHHASNHPDDWAVTNRILCDFFHRGKEPAERNDDFWAPALEVA